VAEPPSCTVIDAPEHFCIYIFPVASASGWIAVEPEAVIEPVKQLKAGAVTGGAATSAAGVSPVEGVAPPPVLPPHAAPLATNRRNAMNPTAPRAGMLAPLPNMGVLERRETEHASIDGR
jgi:hypothetical protein